MGNKIAIVAAKGGVGKTTISHLFCIGSGLNNKPSYLASTDNQRMMPTGNRPYKIVDCRDGDKTNNFVNVSKNTSNEHSFVLDGAANRPDFDLLAAKWGDIVIVPHRSSDLDGDEAVSDIVRFVKNGIDPRRIVTLRTQTRQNEKREDNIHEKLAAHNIKVGSFTKRLDQHASLKYVLNKEFKASQLDSFSRSAAKSIYSTFLRKIELIEREVANA